MDHDRLLNITAACVRHLDTRPDEARRALLAEREPPWEEWARVIRAAGEVTAKELEQYVFLSKRVMGRAQRRA
eukprot:4551637-Pyramimonas_sp.AAC.1